MCGLHILHRPLILFYYPNLTIDLSDYIQISEKEVKFLNIFLNFDLIQFLKFNKGFKEKAHETNYQFLTNKQYKSWKTLPQSNANSSPDPGTSSPRVVLQTFHSSYLKQVDYSRQQHLSCKLLNIFQHAAKQIEFVSHLSNTNKKGLQYKLIEFVRSHTTVSFYTSQVVFVRITSCG